MRLFRVPAGLGQMKTGPKCVTPCQKLSTGGCACRTDSGSVVGCTCPQGSQLFAAANQPISRYVAPRLGNMQNYGGGCDANQGIVYDYRPWSEVSSRPASLHPTLGAQALVQSGGSSICAKKCSKQGGQVMDNGDGTSSCYTSMMGYMQVQPIHRCNGQCKGNC